jgi:hypothetical protein
MPHWIVTILTVSGVLAFAQRAVPPQLAVNFSYPKSPQIQGASRLAEKYHK